MDTEDFMRVKVVCSYGDRAAAVRAAGYIDEPHLIAAMQKPMDIRPCAKYHGWVEKKFCFLRCPHFEDLIFTQGGGKFEQKELKQDE